MICAGLNEGAKWLHKRINKALGQDLEWNKSTYIVDKIVEKGSIELAKTCLKLAIKTLDAWIKANIVHHTKADICKVLIGIYLMGQYGVKINIKKAK